MRFKCKHTHTHTHAHIHAYTHTRARAHTHTHTHTHARTHARTHAHTHTHTHTHVSQGNGAEGNGLKQNITFNIHGHFKEIDPYMKARIVVVHVRHLIALLANSKHSGEDVINYGILSIYIYIYIYICIYIERERGREG